MPVARIFSESASDSAALAAHLHALGYTVEIASPNSEISIPADLELHVERCSREQAVQRARERAAGTGGNVYVGAGVLQCLTPAALATSKVEVLAEHVPLQDGKARNPLSPGVAADLQAIQPEPDEAPASAIPADGDLQPEQAQVGSDVELAAPGSVFASPAEPQVPARAFTLFGTGIADEERAQQEAAGSSPDSEGQCPKVLAEAFGGAAVVLRDSWQQARSASVESAQAAMRQMHEWRNALRSALPHSRSAGVPPVNQGPLKQAEVPQNQNNLMWRPVPGLLQRLDQRCTAFFGELAAMRQRTRQRGVASSPKSEPAVASSRATVGVGTAIAPRNTKAIERELRPMPWAAFAAAGALAVAAMLGWSVLAGRPASPTVPVNSGIEQQVPFGPVKIVPHAMPGSVATKAPTPTPVSTPIPAPKAQQTLTAAAKPAPSATKPQQTPQPRAQQRIARTARHSRPADIAEEEVIVHHYNVSPKPTTKTQTASTGVRHITDQE